MKITVNRGRQEVVCVCCLSEVQLRELWSLSRDGQFWRQDSWQTGHMSGKTMFEEQWSFLGDYEDGGKKKRVNRCELAKKNLQNYKWENLLWISYTVNRTHRERRVVPGSYLLITPDMEEHIVSSLSMRNINCSPEHIKEDVDYAHGKSFARVENTILERVVFGEGVRACPSF